MTESSLPLDHALARRAILKGASLGVGAGLVSAFAAQAQTSSAGTAQASDGPIWSAEYWAKKGDVALNLWRKRVGAPKPGEPPLPVLFLVHGSSNSARSSYDLTVPGKGEYSLMNVFAQVEPERVDRLVLAAFTSKAPARRRSAIASGKSSSTATITAASATRP